VCVCVCQSCLQKTQKVVIGFQGNFLVRQSTGNRQSVNLST